MATIRIHDQQAHSRLLAVDLSHLLNLLGARAAHSCWEVSDVANRSAAIMVSGEEAADQMEVLARSTGRISGDHLAKLATSVIQVIWGEFRAYEDEAKFPWVIVRAIDSTWYEVESEEPHVLELIKSAFKDVRPVD